MEFVQNFPFMTIILSLFSGPLSSVLDGKKKYYALLEFVLGDSEEQFMKDAAVLKELLKGV